MVGGYVPLQEGSQQQEQRLHVFWVMSEGGDTQGKIGLYTHRITHC